MRRIRNDSLGFSAIESLLLAVAVAIIGLTGWYVVHSKQLADKSLQSTASTIKFPTTKVVKIPELGIQLTVPLVLSDLTVSESTTSQYNYSVSTAHLAVLDPACAAKAAGNTALGTLYSPATADMNTVAHVPRAGEGDNPTASISFMPPVGSCSALPSVTSKLAAYQQALIKSLPSITAIK